MPATCADTTADYAAKHNADASDLEAVLWPLYEALIGLVTPAIVTSGLQGSKAALPKSWAQVHRINTREHASGKNSGAPSTLQIGPSWAGAYQSRPMAITEISADALRKQLAESEATVAKMRDKLNAQRDLFDERTAKLTAETRDVNERALRERQSFQQVRCG